MRLRRVYFDLVSAGRKTVEVRVADGKRAGLAVGHFIRFTCDTETLTVQVSRMARYPDFEDLLAAESAEAINPLANPAAQLAALREIYPPEREALGVLAIGIESSAPVVLRSDQLEAAQASGTALCSRS